MFFVLKSLFTSWLTHALVSFGVEWFYYISTSRKDSDRNVGGVINEVQADHSPPPNANVKNTWSYTSTPKYVFMEWFLMGQRIPDHGVALS
jgi:hypothetical protein